ncbi:hypothetical protein Tco_0171689, partial [Tanacetum coccineum]
MLGLKVFLMLFEVTAALIDVNAAQSKLLLPVEVKTAKLMLLVYKLLMLVFRVNVADTKLQLLKD